jgi:AmmeMemoRadiSam system protein B
MQGQVREPVVAGMFYYADPGMLRESLKELFAGTKKGQCTGVVSPHAGYIYSGRTAAEAISSLRPAKTFVLLGPNHSLIGPEFSIMSRGSWRTPLGECRINGELARRLKKNKILEEDTFAHEQEHSIEVQLPFLQYRFREFDFVPISVSNTSRSDAFLESCRGMGETIARQPDVSIIASSDFSHYVPWETAKKQDMEAIRCIEDLDMEGFFEALQKNDASVCGFGPIAVLMSAMKQSGKKGRLITYTSSGEATKDYSSVVAYAAIGFS